MFTIGIILIVVAFFLCSPFDEDQAQPWLWVPLLLGVALVCVGFGQWMCGVAS